MRYSRTATYLLAMVSAGLVFLMIRYPTTAVRASAEGLQIWWDKVFPALFPFFVLSELMIGFGVVTFTGVLMEPLMRPVFRVPGIGGFVFMMGLFSGFPAGARMTAKLYKEQKLTKNEAERLSSFTNFSNPLFLFSVMAVQFFHQATLGILFALSHYIGNIGVGIAMRAYKKKSDGRTDPARTHSVFTNALDRMHQDRVNRYQPLGKMLGDAVIASVQTLLAIGGFIALFSMTYRLLVQAGIINIFVDVLISLFHILGIAPSIGPAAMPGIFELTIGTHGVGSAMAPLEERVITAAALLGFCGFSIQAQAISILSQAGLSARPFMLGRMLHSIFSGIAAWILYHLFRYTDQSSAQPAMAGNPLFQSDMLFPAAGTWFTFTALLIFCMILIRRARHSRH
ncbi:sporulation integral membrane protein YlbJ [Sporolactobacillus vineae]|uniref:sporulation integral membrane protein YlbJ n=1 Tax=Sporolactobacillus vineae TaxID=444463 RepID=UPI000287E2FB|nr:sporulation integral membrane protein YlbJ [Sporolactobacillus vineae]